MLDLRERLAGRPRIVTDAFYGYLDAVEIAFGVNVDYAQLVKIVRNGHTPVREGYSPAPSIVRCDPVQVQGYIPEALISTSYIERGHYPLSESLSRQPALL